MGHSAGQALCSGVAIPTPLPFYLILLFCLSYFFVGNVFRPTCSPFTSKRDCDRLIESLHEVLLLEE